MDRQRRHFPIFLMGILVATVAAPVPAEEPKPPTPQGGPKPLKVFILAGQSNMQGHAHLSTLDSLADDPKTAPLLKEMRGPDGKPKICDQVWISSVGCLGDAYSDLREKHGRLTAGFGAPDDKIGPEFTFGIEMEKQLGEPILLIKTAWGGRSLHTDFRPPSAGPYEWSDYELAQCKRRGDDLDKIKAEKIKATGAFYRHAIEHIKKVLGDIKRVVPEYDPKQGYELAGFVWFQGFNDLVSDWTYDQRMKPGGYDLYGDLLTKFIRDVRIDLSAPKMPFVIGVMGIDGEQANKKAPMMHFREAQRKPPTLDEFKGNVVAVETAAFWDDDLDALNRRREQLHHKLEQEFKKTPKITEEAKEEARKKAKEAEFKPDELTRLKGVSNGGYHYLGAAKILAPIGKAFAEAVLDLRKTASVEPVKMLIPTEPTLAQQLLKESPAELAKEARERGDAGRGAVLFFQPFLTCARCHDAETGIQLGPDLALAGKEATAEYLIESLLLPSKVIKKGYEPLTVITLDGKTITGLFVEEKNGTLTLIDPAGGKRIAIPVADVERRTVGTQSLMPDGLVNTFSDRRQFLDLTKYLIEVAEGGPRRAKELRPANVTFVLPEYENDLDHAGLIRKLDDKAFRRGEAIYSRVCANCHGTKDQPGSLPTSPKFATHVFKNGGDPYSLYQTLTRGYNLMAPQTWMVPRQKYDVIHYLREAYLKPYNPSQYAKTDDAYLASLPKGTGNGPAPSNVEPWAAMDYGPSLTNTYEVGGPGPNIAYKGIAVRLDPGTGGVSRGKSWALFDHDTMRFAAAWTGDGFIDWKGIHFNGQHQVHPKLIGEKLVENPVGPGWADPETGSFKDPRFLGRDQRPYGPLPRKWARFKGTYAYGDRTVIAYTVGDADVLELDGAETVAKKGTVFTRTLEVGKSTRDLYVRMVPDGISLIVVGDARVWLSKRDGFQVLAIPAEATPLRVKVLMSKGSAADLDAFADTTPAPKPLKPLTEGGPRRWPETLKTTITVGKSDDPFEVDTFGLPERNPWNAQMRLTGFDFFPDGKRMAVCTWDGDVWAVGGIDRPEAGLTWQRIASGLFQPLGLKFRDGAIFVCCRDQIVKLHDLNGDGETDFYECFNADHQVTEHFHEFAMGLQTDADGNFYYAKSGRHALPALVPHHGTLLKVSKDGATTEILATGFRAANGVCLNPDGTFFVTDQEGFWTPKNRINLVEKGGFYGNMWGYTDITDTSDSAMKQPLCWITNDFDRSPAELIWVPAKSWGPLGGSLLNTSYGMGKIFVVPHETIDGQAQGGMCALPLPTFPTGIMRPRFHPTDGQLYVCGMYAWAGNQTAPGGFYRVRYTGKPIDLPIALKVSSGEIEVIFTDAIDPGSVEAKNFDVKVWGLKRSKDYGSKHLDERPLAVTKAIVSNDHKSVRLDLPDLAPTWGMEIKYRLKGDDGRLVTGVLHNSIHRFGK